MLQSAEAGDVGKLHAHAGKFVAQIAHVAGHVVADDHAAFFKIAVDLVGVVGEEVAAREAAQLPHAQPVHLAGVAVDGIHGKVEVLPPDAAAVDDEVGKLDDAAGAHAVQFRVERDHALFLVLVSEQGSGLLSLGTPGRETDCPARGW